MKDDIKALKTAYENLLAYTSKLERELSELKGERYKGMLRAEMKGWKMRYGWERLKVGQKLLVERGDQYHVIASWGSWKRLDPSRKDIKFSCRKVGNDVIVTRIQ